MYELVAASATHTHTHGVGHRGHIRWFLHYNGNWSTQTAIWHAAYGHNMKTSSQYHLVYNMYVIFYHINLFNFMQGCGLTTRIKVTFDLI